MSDKYQSDTSQNTSRVKNPLLSAAVTNLTLDDFTHNAVLMPAAMPYVAAPVPVPSGQAANTVNRDYGGAQDMGMFERCLLWFLNSLLI